MYVVCGDEKVVLEYSIKLGITHNTIPHPQYYNRFKKANVDEYVKLIEAAWTNQT